MLLPLKGKGQRGLLLIEPLEIIEVGNQLIVCFARFKPNITAIMTTGDQYIGVTVQELGPITDNIHRVRPFVNQFHIPEFIRSDLILQGERHLLNICAMGQAVLEQGILIVDVLPVLGTVYQQGQAA